MVGVLGPNPSVDTKNGSQTAAILSLKALQPTFQFEDHLVVVLEVFAVAPAVTTRRIDMYRGRHIVLVQLFVVAKAVGCRHHLVVI